MSTQHYLTRLSVLVGLTALCSLALAQPRIIATYPEMPRLASADNGNIQYAVLVDGIESTSAGVLPSMVMDADGDGVADIDDNCANTPFGVRVDECGCVPAPVELVYKELINFEYDSARITPNATYLLRDLMDRLQGEIKTVSIIGHTDSSGRSHYNDELSARRVQRVAQHLVTDYNLPRSKFRKRARGENQPTAIDRGRLDNRNRMKNRRVELSVATRINFMPEKINVMYGEPEKNFRRVHFKIDSTFLLPNAERILDKIAQYMVDNPNLYLEVIGHADETGLEVRDQILLSENRAISVRSQLLQRGIPESRFLVSSIAAKDPLVDVSNKFAWEFNRRVEFVFMQAATSDNVTATARAE